MEGVQYKCFAHSREKLEGERFVGQDETRSWFDDLQCSKRQRGKMGWFRRGRQLSQDHESQVCISLKLECDWMGRSVFLAVLPGVVFSTSTFATPCFHVSAQLNTSSFQYPPIYRDASKLQFHSCWLILEWRRVTLAIFNLQHSYGSHVQLVFTWLAVG